MNNKYTSTPFMINVILAGIVLAMFLFVFFIFGSYLKLQQASPLENFQGSLTNVDLSHTRVTTAIGKYDRSVVCNLVDFKLYIENSVTGDIYVLTKDNLTKAPSANINPGENIPLNFALKLPYSISTGTYTPTFSGAYVCKEGLFTQYKHQNLVTPTFDVTRSWR